MVDHADLGKVGPLRESGKGLFRRQTRASAQTAVASKPRRWALTRVCAHACGVVFVLLVIGFVGTGALFYRLAQGPLSISGLTDRLASELGARLGPNYQVRLGASSLERMGGVLKVSLAGLSVRDARDRPLFVAPRATISISLPRLLIGQVKPTRVELVGVEMGLSVLEDGSLAATAGAEPIVLTPPAEPAPTTAPPAPATTAGHSLSRAQALAPVAKAAADVLNALSDDASPISQMQNVGVSHGRLTFEDKAAGRAITFGDVELGFDRQGGKTELSLAADGPNGRWQAHARAGSFEGSDRALELELRDLSFDEIMLAAGVRAPGFFFNMPLSGKLLVGLDQGGALVGADARFNVGHGYFFTRDEDFEPIFVDAVTGGLRWNAATQRIEIEPTQWIAGATQLTVAGQVSPPSATDGPWRIEFKTGPGSILGPERPTDAPLALDQTSIAANLFPVAEKLEIEKFAIGGRDVNATLSGDIAWGGADRGLRLQVSAAQTSMRALLRIWPSQIAPPAHIWLLDHVEAGMVDTGSLSLDLDGPGLDRALRKLPPDDERMHIDFHISNGSISLLPGVPPLTGVDAMARITGHTVHVAIRQAAVAGAGAHRVNLSETAFSIADTTLEPTPAVANARLGGTLDSLLDILSREGLRQFVGPLGDTSGLKGQVDGRLGVNLLLDKVPHPDDTQVQATATIADLSIDKIVGKEKFEQGQVTLTVDRGGMHASGAGRLLGSPSQIDVKKPAVGPTEANLTFVIDDAARAKIAPAFAASVSGPIIAHASSSLASKDTPAHVDLDFTKTSLDNVLPGLIKPAGRPAKATFRAAAGPDGAHLDQLVFETTSGAAIKGSVDFDNGGNLRAAQLSQLKLSPGDDMRADVEATKEGLKLVVRGQSIDARPFLKGVFSPQAGKSDEKRDGLSGNFDLDLKSALVTGSNREALSNVDLRLARRGSAIRAFQLKARAGRASVTASSAPDKNGVATISVESGDAGSILSFVDLYRRMEGGAMRVNLQVGANGIAGGVIVRDFVLRDEPALRRLVSEGVPQDQADAKKIDTTAAPFQRLSATFSRSANDIVIHDGVLYGSQIGIKIDGSLDYGRNRVNLAGTFVPVYGLNNLFTQIPLVGPLLSGGDHEGLFAVNFRVAGLATAPSLIVNPLSAIAPGFLRKLFSAGQFSPTSSPPLGGGDAPTSEPAPQ